MRDHFQAPIFGAFFMMQNIQHIIFDLGGVILNLKTEEEWLKEDLLPNFHPEALQRLQQQQFFHNFEMGKITPDEFLQELRSIAVDEEISEEKIIQHWNGILKDIPTDRINLLKNLSDNYRLILLSNTNDIHLDFIRNYMQITFGEDVLASHFHTCYYSQKIGLRKPGKEIYEYVLNEQKLVASSCLFLDDKPENLIEPDKLGIQTIQVDFNKLTASTLNRYI